MTKTPDKTPEMDLNLEKEWEPRPPYTRWYDCLLNMDMYGVMPYLELRGKRKI